MCTAGRWSISQTVQMSQQLKTLSIIALLASALIACARGGSSDPVLPDGPVLVMFYTDN